MRLPDPEVRPGTKLVAELCCNHGTLHYENGCVVWTCPHMRLIMANNEVISAQTLGSRQ